MSVCRCVFVGGLVGVDVNWTLPPTRRSALLFPMLSGNVNPFLYGGLRVQLLLVTVVTRLLFSCS